MRNAESSLPLAKRLFSLHGVRFRATVALSLLLITSGFAIASNAPAQQDVESAAGGVVASCQEHFQSGHDFHLGNARESANILLKPQANASANANGTVKRGDRVVIGASLNGMLCIEVAQSGSVGWVPQKSIEHLNPDGAVSKDAWAGVWKDSDGSWFIVSPNFDNSVTIVDGWTHDVSTKSFGSLRGLNGSTEDGLSGMARTLLFKKAVVMNMQLSPSQQQIVREGICRFHALLLTDVLVVSDQRGFCGGTGTTFDGVYKRVEDYPLPSVKTSPTKTSGN